MKINVNKAISSAARDGSITKTEAKGAATQIQRGGASLAEKAAVRSALNLYADSFERGAKEPLRQLIIQSSSASTVSSGEGTPGVGGTISSDMGKAFGPGYGLTSDQERTLRGAGVEPGTDQWRQQELQLKMANYTNKMSAVSNIGKMLTDLTASIIRNIRS